MTTTLRLITGGAWNVEDDPTKPFMNFDVHADLKLPLGFTYWLEHMGTGFGSYEVLLPEDSPLEIPVGGLGVYDGSTALLRLRVRTGAEYKIGAKYPLTVRLLGDDATSQDDATLYFKLVEK